MEIIALIVVAVLVVGALLAASGRITRDVNAAMNARVGEMAAEVGSIEQRLDRRFSELDGKVDRRLEGLDGRLLSTQRSAGQTATEIAEKLGKVEGATKQMLSRADDLAKLEQALRPPKARGGFGELLLGNLLADVLPSAAYELQYGFRTGERVDAVIRVDRLVPVDAKFPLDNFHRVLEAGSEDERALAQKAFARDVRTHIDAIAGKYIRPGEGTYDFAFMYVPAEAVYYELVCGGTGALYAHALERRVFPVSPNTFHAYLQMIVLGLKGLQIERHAEEVMAYCGQLATDFAKFRTDFELVGKHLGNAHTKFSDSQRRLDRFETRLEQAVDEQALEERGTTLRLPLPEVDAA